MSRSRDSLAGGSLAAARAEALGAISRRPRTVAEIRQRLTGRNVPSALIDEAVAQLAGEGHLDDVALARHYVVTRSERLGHGRTRLSRDLERRGVDPADFDRAWEAALADGELDPRARLRAEIRRRAGGDAAGLDRKNLRRIYNALLRAGFDASSVRAELLDRAAPAAAQEFDDDL